MVPASVEQKLRLPLPGIGNPTAKYAPAGLLPIPVELKVYPFFGRQPAQNQSDMRHFDREHRNWCHRVQPA